MSNRTLGLGGSDLPRPGRCGREREREIQIYTKRYKDIVSCWEIESLPIPVGAWSWRVPCCWAASLDDSTTRRCSSFTVSYVCYVSFVFRSFSGRLGGERRRLDDSVRFFLVVVNLFRCPFLCYQYLSFRRGRPYPDHSVCARAGSAAGGRRK